ncbi:MAG: DUF3604 domain-containing protein [Alphaproteobacteria bacterium]|nr:MAG: DUF3604 domain-containing protein [Alphaproteobacteria bacterium]
MKLTHLLALSTALVAAPVTMAQADEERHLFWGDTHLHTNYSFDAYLFQNQKMTPEMAYRYAKGLPVVRDITGTRTQIETPLDFLVVADHAELTAIPKRIFEQDALLMKTRFGKRIKPLIEQNRGSEVFAEIVALANAGGYSEELIELTGDDLRRPAWEDLVNAAEAANEPGKFTAFIGWEWSSLPDAANLHRVVMTPDNAEMAKKYLPYSSTVSTRPEDLWAWLEKTEAETGAEFLAIPHNMNISKGLMFPETDSDGRSITAEYARTRIEWEPIAEVTQYKGDSETHPLLSPDDPFADFESYRHLIDLRPDTDHLASVTPGDYARGALRRGLEIEQSVGTNPYKFGMIGSTDAHTGLASVEENNFNNKFPIYSTPAVRSSTVSNRIGGDGPTGWSYGAQGLAAVWAEENTREALFDAFKRKEVYATTGPRMMVRFFGGWNFKDRDARASDLGKRGYGKGVPMGGDLTRPSEGGLFGSASAPSFLIQAVKDPKGGNLDRLQIVKGWVDADGVSHEKVYNVIGADNRKPDAEGNLTPVGNTVDIKTAHYTNTIGDEELSAVWQDPDFDPDQRAFYYARVLQIPTPRHSLYDAVALNIELREGVAATIQERAYTSPIWYTP